MWAKYGHGIPPSIPDYSFSHFLLNFCFQTWDFRFHKRLKYEDLPCFSSISPLYLMPISISITTNITTYTTDATTITTTSSTNTNPPMGMLY